MSKIPALLNTIQAARELRLRRMAALAQYRLGLRSGHYRRTVNAALAQRLADGVRTPAYRPIWRVPTPADLRAAMTAADEEQLLAEVEEILAGRVRLFGAEPVPLRLAPPRPLLDWTAYERGAPAQGSEDPSSSEQASDVKWLWEPARFGWAYTLGRAYCLTGDERCAQFFWQHAEAFLDAAPPYLGPHWASAQEVALRLIALTFALHVFQPSPHTSAERVLRLLRAVAIHAGRIPATLVYARAQDNNHLLSEAAGLATAAALLPHHPQAARWQRVGWREFRRGLRSQIAPDGAYSQHSSNYHRLMLQLGVWMANLASAKGASGEGRVEDEAGLDLLDRQQLAAATGWLLALVDPASGRVPNLGPNDGAYIFPFSVLPFGDYRPALQAAGQAFLGRLPFPPGAWDEMGLWFQNALSGQYAADPARPPGSTPHMLHAPDGRSWAYLRAVRFTARPGHADQLHLDLWRDGSNVAVDAGTYAYNAPAPWDNALAGTLVHNTVTVHGLDQMRRAGRFLYVDWAQAEVLPQEPGASSRRALAARHTGYRRLGLVHERRVQVDDRGDWEIVDLIDGPGWRTGGAASAHMLALHWLLPDWPWHAFEAADGVPWRLELDAPVGRIKLTIRVEAAGKPVFQLVRAGELLQGSGSIAPILGWVSPTYGVKIPALSVRCTVTASSAVRFISRFCFNAPREDV